MVGTRLGFSVRGREKLIEAAAMLREAEKPVRMLRSVAWPEDAYAVFMKAKARALPVIEYTPSDPGPTHEHTRAARKLIDGSSPVHQWLSRTADVVDVGAEMVGTVGTRAFHDHSCTLYGSPSSTLTDNLTRPIDLAHSLDKVRAGFSHEELHLIEVPVTYTAEELVEQMRPLIHSQFGDSAPRPEIVDHLSSKAIAGGRYIRFRKDAAFSDRDSMQLLQHEAYVHIGTTLNGHRRSRCGCSRRVIRGRRGHRKGLRCSRRSSAARWTPAGCGVLRIA